MDHSSGTAPKIARVAPRSQAFPQQRFSHAPNLATQHTQLADVKRKIADRKRLLDKLSKDQIKIKAESTQDRQWPLHQVDLLKATPKILSTEGSDLVIKHEIPSPHEFITKNNLAEIKAKKEALAQKLADNKRIKSKGGTRFEDTPIIQVEEQGPSDPNQQIPAKYDAMGQPLDAWGNRIIAKVVKTVKINQRQSGRERFQKSYISALAEKPESQEQALTKVEKKPDAVDAKTGALAADVLRENDLSAISKESKFFDSRFKEKKRKERKSFFSFHDEGEFIKKGKQLRQQARLKELQNQIETATKRTGIHQASKLATVAHSAVKDTMALTINELDWWDKAIIEEHQQNIEEDFGEEYSFLDLSKLIEHPLEIAPPMKTTSLVQLPVYLTKTERRKIRRLRRREEQKEEQEKIRLGLCPAPEAKVRLANMMHVLGNEAVVDPSKVEARVREQMAQRLKKHFAANKARMLTKDQKREKVVKKLKEDLSHAVDLSIWLVKDLSHAATRWKIKENAKQLYMTGCLVTTPDHAIVVLEGGPKSQRKFRRLMLHRIRWKELVGEEEAIEEESKAEVRTRICDNKGQELCKLVWTGQSKKPTFNGDMIIIKLPNDTAAKDFFQQHNIMDYWHLIQSKVLICGTD